MASAVEVLFSFTGFAAAALAAALLLRRRKIGTKTATTFSVALIAYFLGSLYAVPYGIARVLVRPYGVLTPPVPADGVTAIVTLGGGNFFVRGWDGQAFPMHNVSAAARMVETRRVYGFYPNAWVISSGGPAAREGGLPSNAQVMKDALITLGIPESRILLETASLDTHDQATRVAPMLKQLNPARVVLVTSDIHMRRSIGAFRAAGISAIPAIARDPYLPFDWRRWLIPSILALNLSGDVAHEFIGLGYYAVRGWLK